MTSNLLLVLGLFSIICLFGQTGVLGALWCPGNQVVTGIINDPAPNVNALGTSTTVYNLVAIGPEFKVFVKTYFAGRPDTDVAIYSFNQAESVMNPPFVIPFETFRFSSGVGNERPRLLYDGTNTVIVYRDTSPISPTYEAILSREVDSNGALQAPILVIAPGEYNRTSRMGGFIELSRPTWADGSRITMLLAYMAPRTSYLTITAFDRGFQGWVRSEIEPFPPTVTGGVEWAAGPVQMMICVVGMEWEKKVLCYTSSAFSFAEKFTQVTGEVPLVPFKSESHVFVASCGKTGHFMVGTSIDQGVTGVAYTTNSGQTWSTVRSVPQVGPSFSSKLVGFMENGVCKYSFASRVLYGDLVMATSDSAFNFPSGNIETIFPTSNDYDEPYFASNSSKTLLTLTRLNDPAYLSDNAWFVGCKTVPTSSPTLFPTNFPTTLAPTLFPTNFPTTKAPTKKPITSTSKPTKFPFIEHTFRPTPRRLTPTVPVNPRLEFDPGETQESAEQDNTVGIAAGVSVTVILVALAVATLVMKRRTSIHRRQQEAIRNSMVVNASSNLSSANPHFQPSTETGA